jgi:hypothetical protein
MDSKILGLADAETKRSIISGAQGFRVWGIFQQTDWNWGFSFVRNI